VEAITGCLADLQTLDLSFCTKISFASLATLLQVRGTVVTELRLWHCRPRGTIGPFLRVLQALRHDCSLSVLDLRDCALDTTTTLLSDLLELHFIESSSFPGFFTREPRWGRTPEQRFTLYFKRSIYGMHHRIGA
jgi:hypothetical protein